MTNTYTLELIHEHAPQVRVSPSVMLASSLAYSLAVSLSSSIYALALASLLPLMLMNRIAPSRLVKLNVLNIIMILTLTLTWPEYLAGFMMGLTIALRVNMIYIAFGALVYPMGYTGVFESLVALRVPEKLRVLLLLTVRGVFIMRDRYSSALMSVRLRAPGLRGMAKFRTFAYVLASVLLQSSERSERIMRAVQCRGGFDGFIQGGHERVGMRDLILLAVFLVYSLAVIILNYA